METANLKHVFCSLTVNVVVYGARFTAEVYQEGTLFKLIPT